MQRLLHPTDLAMAEAGEEHFLFKSLSSPIRLRILQLLDKQPLSYTELMKDVGMGRKQLRGSPIA
ncbi:MAG: winged helix-turn-helix domain-containing protein [Candidatus Caldarchaeum sp.]|nr:winged helix-turn-helix domain-containing protein [Candidatus Caldarchaeum sp.]